MRSVCVPGGHGAEHVIAAQMPHRVVDTLEMVEIEQQERQGGAVPPRIGHLAREPFGKMFAIERLGERILHARFVELPKPALFGFVGEPEADLDRRAKADAVPFGQRVARDALAANEGAVARPQVFDDVRTGALSKETRMAAADAGVVDSDRTLFHAPDMLSAGINVKMRPRVGAADQGQRGAIAHRDCFWNRRAAMVGGIETEVTSSSNSSSKPPPPEGYASQSWTLATCLYAIFRRETLTEEGARPDF